MDPYPDPYSHKIPGLPYEHPLTPDFDSMSCVFLGLFYLFFPLLIELLQVGKQ